MPQDKVFIRERLILDPTTGTIDVVHEAKPLLKKATAEVVYRRRGERRSLSLAQGGVAYKVAGDEVSLSKSDGEMELTWHIAVDDETTMWLEVRNLGQEPLQVDELRALVVDRAWGSALNLGSQPGEWSFYQNGWQSWTPTFARHVADGLYVELATEGYRRKHQPHPLPPRPKTLVSQWFTVITERRERGDERRGLLLGFITTKDQLAEIRLQADAGFRRLAAICYADGVVLQPGERLSSELLLIAPSDEPLALLERYAEALGERMGARCGEEPLTGWCAWYYFYGENTERDILANLKRIRAERLPLSCILVDDGYQKAIGDWLDIDEEKYPQGMKELAGEISASGYIPGIWIAPFAVASDSRLYATHPDWAIADEQGKPAVAWQRRGVDVYGLDLTSPEVQDWLRSVLRTMSDDWGYKVFKVDFAYAAALDGKRHNRQMTRAQALRKGLEIVREAVGESFVLGCGMPLGPAVGLVDGMRVGPDVAINWRPFWRDLSFPAAENALRNAIARSFMHRRLWLNDPDCVLVRPRHDESDLVLNEMRTLVSVVGLCGGLTLSGDNFPTIRKGRLKYLRQILPPYGKAAVPLDLFENEMPRLLALPIETDWGWWLVVGVINWGDHTTETVVDLSQLVLDPDQSYHVYNYWRRRYLGIARNRLILPWHQPQCTALLLFKPVSDEPDLLTSTFHITQGGVEVKSVERRETGDERQTLIVELEKSGVQFGQLLFTVPGPWRTVEARVNGRRRGVNQVAEGVIGIGFTLDDWARVEVDFQSKA